MFRHKYSYICFAALFFLVLLQQFPAQAREWKQFRSEDLNFQIDFPGNVERSEGKGGVLFSAEKIRTSNVLGIETKDVFTYMVTVLPTGSGADPESILQTEVDEVKSRQPNLTELSKTSISCNGYHGIQATYAIFEPGVRYNRYKLAAGTDFRVLEVGDNTYLFQVVYTEYPKAHSRPFAYMLTPFETKKFFGSFKILKSKAITGEDPEFPNSIFASWYTKGDKGEKLWIFSEEKKRVYMGNTLGRRIKITEDSDPKQIDIDLSWAGKKAVRLGIYKVNNDRLTLCLTKEGVNERPVEFEDSDKAVLHEMRLPGNRIF